MLDGRSGVASSADGPGASIRDAVRRRMLFVAGLCVVAFLLVLSAVAWRGNWGAQTRTVKATAFNSVSWQTDHRPNEGAWGDVIEPGDKVLAVSRDLEALGLVRGTKVRVEGLDGTWVVLDRTHRRKRNQIDIYMGTDVAAARQWGVREVEIRW